MGKKFNYADPDNDPKPGATVATIDIALMGNNLCMCGKEGQITITIDVDVSGSGGKSPLQNFNKIAADLGEFIIDGNTVKFPIPKPTDPNSSTATASFSFKRPECPDKEKPKPEHDEVGKGTIKVVDLTRKGKRTRANLTGISQIYEYSWAYKCEQTEKDGKCEGCREEKKFNYDVKLLSANTVVPNL